MIKFPRGMPHGAKRMLWEKDIHSKLESIARAEARLHKINLSSREHKYKALTELGIFKDASDLGWQNPSYDRKYIRQFEDFLLSAFVNPKNKYFPALSMSIHPRRNISPEKHKRFLDWLNNCLPDLNVSKVEYAVDLFCGSPDNVRSVFEVLKKFLYILRQRKINIIDDSGKRPYPGRVYHIGESYKVYERGQDFQKQKGSYWRVKHLDRVRVEYTAKQTPLKKQGIYTLQDLIDDPKFIYVNWDKWLFRHFDYTKRLRYPLGSYGKKLPAPYERYRVKDKSGHSGTFYSEYFHAKDTLKNVSLYLRQPYVFNVLESLLYEAMSRFGKEWRGSRI
ncbi:MAG: hypothetical protein WBB70_01570 [Desulfobacterales bacterium]